MKLIRFYLIGIYLLIKEKKQREKRAAGNAIFIFALHFMPILAILMQLVYTLFPDLYYLFSNKNYFDVFKIAFGICLFIIFIISYSHLERILLTEISSNEVKITGWKKMAIYGTLPFLILICVLIIQFTSKNGIHLSPGK